MQTQYLSNSKRWDYYRNNLPLVLIRYDTVKANIGQFCGLVDLVPILAASDLIQALTLIIATFGFYSYFFITFDRSNWRRIISLIIRDTTMDGTHPKVL